MGGPNGRRSDRPYTRAWEPQPPLPEGRNKGGKGCKGTTWFGDEVTFGGGGVAPQWWQEEREGRWWERAPAGWGASWAPWERQEAWEERTGGVAPQGKGKGGRPEHMRGRHWTSGECLVAFWPAYLMQSFPPGGTSPSWDELASEAERIGFQIVLRGRSAPGKARACKLFVFGPQGHTWGFYDFLVRVVMNTGNIDLK